MDLDQLPIKKGFRLRGKDITRLETFTDAAFAFAVTMLVIAGDSVPKDYNALMASLKDIPSFAASIALILYIWFGHLQWSRRYGLEDGASVVLSGFLILTILVFVYPLKLVFAAMFAFFGGEFWASDFAVTSASEVVGLFIFYGFGFTITCLIMATLYYYAGKKRTQLQLNRLEVFETNASIAEWLWIGLPAFLSALAAWLLPIHLAIWSGFFNFLYFIISPGLAIKTARNRQALKESLLP